MISTEQLSRWHDAVDAKDAAFDGLFWVGITSTRIYCRPVCPSRRARRENRRFFTGREAAVAAGFRACLRCRPDAAYESSPMDAVPRLAFPPTLRDVTHGMAPEQYPLRASAHRLTKAPPTVAA